MSTNEEEEFEQHWAPLVHDSLNVGELIFTTPAGTEIVEMLYFTRDKVYSEMTEIQILANFALAFGLASILFSICSLQAS